ncbi:hypothetical protein [Botrimarina mediterranea]|uniref:hypothetical protein n=1 Tax=Botrimarina mediterranea TaxID=2528022 RepID=UPI00118A5B07|nr:hypothetical protein K2D_42170 [Planctomycetes bacterium K2D]
MTHHRRIILRPLVAWLAALSCLTPLAQAKCPHGHDCLVCVPKREATKEEKCCWCVEGKNVSVPPVLCPWEPGGSPINTFDWLERLLGHGESVRGKRCGKPCHPCQPGCQCVRCGEVRQVRDLVEKTYQVNARQWKWEVRRLPPCKCGQCGCEVMDASGAFGCGCPIGG